MFIDMDLAEDRAIVAPGTKDPIRAVDFKRDTSAAIQVRFWQAGVQVELADAAAAGKFAIKPLGQYDAEPLVAAESWVKTGSGAATVYSFYPSFNGAALAALLNSGDGNAANDLTSVLGMMEIQWVENGNKHRSQTITASISNDVIKTTDYAPGIVPSAIGTTAPVNATRAGVAIDPAGANNTLIWYAATLGAAGNLISIQYLAPVGGVGVTFQVTGTQIIVHPAKTHMVVTGTLTSDGATPVLFSSPIPFDSYFPDDYPLYNLVSVYSIGWMGTAFQITHESTGAQWISSGTAASPELVTTWIPQGTATGNPVVTATISTAAQVKTAAEASAPVSALVTIGTIGLTTGAVAAVAATNLTEGADATATPPYIRIDDAGMVYMKKGDSWGYMPLLDLPPV